MKDGKAADNTLWHVYLIENRLQHLYAGISVDPVRRLQQHQAGKGAKALRGKGPLIFRFCVSVNNHSDALQAELWLKKQKRQTKWQLIEGIRRLPFDHQDCLSLVLASLEASN